MDRIQAMQVFRCVAELASFTKAAQQLDLPKATVTSAIQQLEAGVGVRLLNRTTRTVSLTQEGALYLEHCGRVLDELLEAESLFGGAVRPSGIVRVDLPERLARTTVIPRLPEFFSRYPDIRIRLGVTDRLVDPVGEGVDCVVRVGALRDSSLVARQVGVLEQTNAGAPSYFAQYGRPRSLADLQEHVAVSFISSKTGRPIDWEYRLNGKDHFIKMRSLISVTSSDAYQTCCLAGLGLIQAPRAGMQALLETGALEEVLTKWRPAPLPVSVIYAQQGYLSQRVRVFIDWLIEVLAVQ